MLECGFESRLGLEFVGFNMWYFLKLLVRGFLRVLWFPPLLHGSALSANKIKQKQMQFKLCTLVVTLLQGTGGCRTYWVCSRTGQPGVSILRLDEIATLICNFYLSL